MDEVRASFSKFKKGIKQRIKRGKPKRGGEGAVPVGGVDLLESESQPVGGSSHDQGASVVGEPVDTARPSLSRDEPGPASAGETDKEGGGTDVDRSKVNTVQESGLLSPVGVLVGTGYSDEVKRAHSSSSSTPNPRVAMPSGTSTSSPFLLSLIIPPKIPLSFLITNRKGFAPRVESTQPVNLSVQHIRRWNRIYQRLRP